jgi:prolyl oligopeptidase
MRSRPCIPAIAASACAMLLAIAAAAADHAPYPESRTGDVVDTWHGTRVADPYRWLEATNSDETRAWIAAQNRYSRAFLREDPRRDAIRARIEALSAAWPTDEVPVHVGEYVYIASIDPATSRSALYVRKGPQGKRRPALDLSGLPDGYALKAFVPSPDGSHLAYTVDAGGTDWGEIRIRDVDADKDLPEVLRDVRFSGSVAWSADGKGFLYRRYATPASASHDAPAEGAAIHRHRLGTPRSADRLVYALPSDSTDWSLAFALSEDRRRMYLHVERGPWLAYLGGSRQRVSTAPLDTQGLPSGTRGFVALTRREAAYRVIGSVGNRLYVMTDLDAPRSRLVAIDLRQPAPAHWRTIIPESAAVMESVHRFGERFVASYLVDVHSELRTYDMQGKPLGDIALPGLGIVRKLTGEARSPGFRFEFTSLLQPPVVLHHDLRNGTTEVEIKGNLALDLGAFETRQLWFESKDGTRVPMYVVARRDLVRDGSHPTILYGYGASGTNVLPEFSEDVIAWIEMGGVYAIANVRGGGEFGKAWYEAAVRERKQTSFDDLIAAAEHLVAQDYTSPRKLAIRGGSNGGLLVTASMIQRPSLFAVVLANVPVTDALRRTRSGTGAVQSDQWGTPQDPLQFKAMHAYSPLHNVVKGRCYPATLITTAANDDRLPPWHAYKFGATLQAAQSCDAPILLRVRSSGGHGGSDEFGAWFDETADQLAFAARRLRLEPK